MSNSQAKQPDPLDNLIASLRVMKARHAAGIATRGPLSHAVHRAAGTGHTPGRMVYDMVTGQHVEVIGTGVIHVHPSLFAEGQNG